MRVAAPQAKGVKKTMATPPPTKKRRTMRSRKIVGPFFLWMKPMVQRATDKPTIIAAMPVRR